MKNLNEYQSTVELNTDTSQFVSLTNEIHDNYVANTNEIELSNSIEYFSNDNYDIYSEESDEEYKSEKLNKNRLCGKKGNETVINTFIDPCKSHLLLTDTINIYNKNKIKKEYENWLKENYDMLQSSFYIISNNFLDSNKKITFKKFSEFCFLYY